MCFTKNKFLNDIYFFVFFIFFRYNQLLTILHEKMLKLLVVFVYNTPYFYFLKFKVFNLKKKNLISKLQT